MKTVVPKVDSVDHQWFIVDANQEVLGRIASRVAAILRGKHKPQFSPHLDMGDHVIVINAEKIRITGRKFHQKRYTRYTGYPGGLRVSQLEKWMHDKPDKVLLHAVKGMLPKNRLGRKMIKKLKIYNGSDHPHQAQKPVELPSSMRKK